MVEALYTGCVPAFIADKNIYPFQDIFDYSLFSVTISENEAHRIEQILQLYDEETIASLQVNGLRVREAFLYANESGLERTGPLFYALVSMKMRLSLSYGSCAIKLH